MRIRINIINSANIDNKDNNLKSTFKITKTTFNYIYVSRLVNCYSLIYSYVIYTISRSRSRDRGEMRHSNDDKKSESSTARHSTMPPKSAGRYSDRSEDRDRGSNNNKDSGRDKEKGRDGGRDKGKGKGKDNISNREKYR